MNNLILLLKSFRLLNVFSMLLLLVGLRFYFWKHIIPLEPQTFERTPLEFTLFLFIVGLISALGYLVNDIFDVNVDKVNKSYKKLAFTKPILWSVYIIGNILAVLLILFSQENALTELIFFSTILTLFFYSLIFQRFPFVGNFNVALLAGVLPVLYLSFELFTSYIDLFFVLHLESVLLSIKLVPIISFYCFLGFGLTLLRELVKDVEDINGDESSGYKTLPVLIGVKGSKVLFYLLVTLFMVSILFFDYNLFSHFLFDHYLYYIPALILLLIAVYQVYLANFSKASLFLKLTLFSGVLVLFIL